MPKINDFAVIIAIGTIFILSIRPPGIGRAADDQGKGHRNSNEVSGRGGPAPWGYAGTEGPEFWGSLSPDDAVCSSGPKTARPFDPDTPVQA